MAPLSSTVAYKDQFRKAILGMPRSKQDLAVYPEYVNAEKVSKQASKVIRPFHIKRKPRIACVFTSSRFSIPKKETPRVTNSLCPLICPRLNSPKRQQRTQVMWATITITDNRYLKLTRTLHVVDIQETESWSYRLVSWLSNNGQQRSSSRATGD